MGSIPCFEKTPLAERVTGWAWGGHCWGRGQAGAAGCAGETACRQG